MINSVLYLKICEGIGRLFVVVLLRGGDDVEIVHQFLFICFPLQFNSGVVFRDQICQFLMTISDVFWRRLRDEDSTSKSPKCTHFENVWQQILQPFHLQAKCKLEILGE